MTEPFQYAYPAIASRPIASDGRQTNNKNRTSSSIATLMIAITGVCSPGASN